MPLFATVILSLFFSAVQLVARWHLLTRLKFACHSLAVSSYPAIGTVLIVSISLPLSLWCDKQWLRLGDSFGQGETKSGIHAGTSRSLTIDRHNSV